MTTSWDQIKSAYTALIDAADREADVVSAWSRFINVVVVTASKPPYHLATLLEMLARVDKPRSEIRILEHGFGSGSALLYLLALGFNRIHGVDLGGPVAALNRVAAVAGLAAPPFAIYCGRKLPYADASFDFVFSQQVLEHVAPAVIDTYYIEEARILVSGGLAYHQVPHRLVPYDSHTRTWFVHYLPRPIAHRIYRLLGLDPALAREHLFLRMPGFHRRRMSLHFGHCLDVTDRRLRRVQIEGYYDGPAKLRTFIGALINMPVIGAAATALLKKVVMIDTLSIKQGPPFSSSRAMMPYVGRGAGS